MTRNKCETRDYNPCIFNLLLQTLDTLQRRAYEEIKLKVLTAVGKRLPGDLTLMIFEHTMA
jgi:hypothetical protein